MADDAGEDRSSSTGMATGIATEMMERTPDRPTSKRVQSGEREGGPSSKKQRNQDDVMGDDKDGDGSGGDSSEQGSTDSDGLLGEAERDAQRQSPAASRRRPTPLTRYGQLIPLATFQQPTLPPGTSTHCNQLVRPLG